MKVLILTAATGGGHAKAAEALAECLAERHPEWEAVIADSLKCISPIVDRLVVGAYLGTVKNTPNLYGKLYDLSERERSLTDLTRAFNRLLSYRLYDFIESCKPSVVVCTHSFPLQMLSRLKRKHRISIPVIGIVTDFVSHFFWKLDGIDALIVSHRHIKEDMMKIGIPGGIIHTFGIPVSGAFRDRPGRRSLLRELDLEDKTTLLVMGGSLGIGEVKSIFGSLLKCDRDLQLIAVTGWNERLKSQLEELSLGSGKSVSILGYSDRVYKLMGVSDLIITKPGGVTGSEARGKKLPILIIPPIPGQEERNARFLEDNGAAVRLPPDGNPEEILCRLLDNPLKLRHMREMAGRLSKPGAGGDIIRLIEALAGERPAPEKTGQGLIPAII